MPVKRPAKPARDDLAPFLERASKAGARVVEHESGARVVSFESRRYVLGSAGVHASALPDWLQRLGAAPPRTKR